MDNVLRLVMNWIGIGIGIGLIAVAAFIGGTVYGEFSALQMLDEREDLALFELPPGTNPDRVRLYELFPGQPEPSPNATLRIQEPEEKPSPWARLYE